MATLKLERGGKKASLMNKFKVLIDGKQVGELKKYGHSAEFDGVSRNAYRHGQSVWRG